LWRIGNLRMANLVRIGHRTTQQTMYILLLVTSKFCWQHQNVIRRLSTSKYVKWLFWSPSGWPCKDFIFPNSKFIFVVVIAMLRIWSLDVWSLSLKFVLEVKRTGKVIIICGMYITIALSSREIYSFWF